MKAPILAFDVNETLLSLEPLSARLSELFGDPPPTGEWFARMLHASLVANELDSYRPFSDIGVEALVAVAARHGVEVDDGTASDIVGTMNRLPLHPDVFNAMERLFDHGYAMVALTNGSTEVANSQIENAGLHIFMRRVISVAEVGKYKPHPLPYRHAAGLMGVDPSDLVLIAAHDWDCAGAMAAGSAAVFLKRPGSIWSLPSQPPRLAVSNLTELAEAITRIPRDDA